MASICYISILIFTHENSKIKKGGQALNHYRHGGVVCIQKFKLASFLIVIRLNIIVVFDEIGIDNEL